MTLERLFYQNITPLPVRKHSTNFVVHALYVPPSVQEEGLLFDSRFECGNLKKAIRVNANEYNLLIEPDFNTRGHMHWFCFRVFSRLPKG